MGGGQQAFFFSDKPRIYFCATFGLGKVTFRHLLTSQFTNAKILLADFAIAASLILSLAILPN